MTIPDEEMLLISALESCEWRGHNMTGFTGLDDTCYQSICVVCGKSVYVELEPLPNEIDISGEAVALNCN